jgi:hypothetical protein
VLRMRQNNEKCCACQLCTLLRIFGGVAVENVFLMLLFRVPKSGVHMEGIIICLSMLHVGNLLFGLIF